MNGANSLPDSDLSLIDVSPWGNTGQGVARQGYTLGACQGTKTPLWTCGGHSTTRTGHVECESRRSNALCVPYALPLHLANQSQLPSLLPDTAFLIFLEFF